MIHILRGAQVYAPQPRGVCDVILAGNQIAAVLPPGQFKCSGVPISEWDGTDKILVPGFIDSHVHILGGGGEGGPATRAPEITLDDVITSGVTTLIGCLGTDGITRHMSSLLAKAKGLEAEGITAYLFTGSYEIPVQTLTESVRTDLVFIDRIIGAGEIALSDHRSSQPTFQEFCRLAAECRVGGMLGGKAGILHCHMGEGPRHLEYLFRMVQETEIPCTQIIPTHCNRNADLLEEGIAFVKQGGYIDLTASLDPTPSREGHLSISDCVNRFRDEKLSLDHITISSDSNGSMPVFDDNGQLTGLTIATQKSLLANFRYLLSQHILDIPEALGIFSRNAAIFYKFPHKGRIQEGKDADLLAFDRDWNLTDVIAKGQTMMAECELQKTGTFSNAEKKGYTP